MRTDPVSLASGAAVAALGALVLLDSSGAVEVSLGWIAVALSAALGVIVVVSGLAKDDPGRQD